MRARGEIAGGRKAIKELAKSLQLPSSPNLTSLVPAGGEEIGSFSWAIKAGEVQRPCVRRARLTGWQPCPARTHLRTLGYCGAEDVGAGGGLCSLLGAEKQQVQRGSACPAQPKPPTQPKSGPPSPAFCELLHQLVRFQAGPGALQQRKGEEMVSLGEPQNQTHRIKAM